ISEIYTYMDLPDYFRTHGVATAEGVVGYLFQVALGNDYSDVEWDMAIGVLTMDGNIPFDLNAADAEERLQRLLALVMSYPGYQLQWFVGLHIAVRIRFQYKGGRLQEIG
ncbi:MAG: hypothetical protein GY934_04800, partial [Gammaproteobacteria bacterium]|nr:hypothetical protein [Gammaproteobacteria bacterium]